MATQATTLTRPLAPASAGVMLPAFTLWWREIVRFYRQPTRVVGVLASPLVFWLVIGSGFGTSFRSGGGPGQQHYLDYFYPGALIMIVLFTSIFTMMSVIEDRKEGFLLSVLVAPVPRTAIVLGKVLGGTTLSAVQGLIFLIFAPFAGVHLELAQVLLAAVVVFLVSFALTALGFAIAWPMDSSQAFHGIVNLFLIPLWLLSGALFPIQNASKWIKVIMRLNPLTYGVEALRGLLYPGAETTFPLPSAMATLRSVFAGNVWTRITDGKPPHHEARRLIVGNSIAEQYAFFPALNATLNGTSAALLLTGRSPDCSRAHCRTPRLHDCCGSCVGSVSGVLSILPLQSRKHSIPGRGMGTSRLFHDSDFPCHTGDRHRAAGDHHFDSRAEGAVSAASGDRALDVAFVDVCFRHGCDCLFHALPMVPAQLVASDGDSSR